MSELEKAARQALEALERIANPAGDWPASITARRNDAIKALRSALSHPKRQVSMVFGGYETFGDSGGGIYIHDPCDATITDNGGAVIISHTKD